MSNSKVMSMLQQLVEDAKTMEAEAVRAENSQEPQGQGSERKQFLGGLAVKGGAQLQQRQQKLMFVAMMKNQLSA